MSRRARVEAALAILVDVFFEPPPAESRPDQDELVALAACGLERAALRRLIASGELRARKIGRRLFALRSDLAKLINSVPQAPVSPSQISQADVHDLLAARARKTAAKARGAR